MLSSLPLVQAANVLTRREGSLEPLCRCSLLIADELASWHSAPAPSARPNQGVRTVRAAECREIPSIGPDDANSFVAAMDLGGRRGRLDRRELTQDAISVFGSSRHEPGVP